MRDDNYCPWYYHYSASMGGPEEWGCNHKASEGGVCSEEECPLLAHEKVCAECDDWIAFNLKEPKFGYCTKHGGLRTASDGCTREAAA